MTNKDKLQRLFNELVDIDSALKRYDLDELKDLSEYALNLIEIDKYLNTYDLNFNTNTGAFIDLLGDEQ